MNNSIPLIKQRLLSSACSLLFLSSLNFLVNVAHAGELVVEYKTFHSHVKKLNSEDTNALQFAFGFLNIHTKSLCKIESARISTQKKQIPLAVSPENRFTVPNEKALRQADAKVILVLKEASNICDISVQLETKPEYLKDIYTKQDLQYLYEQYQAFFNEMGGFMSFMMPQVEGITFQFNDTSLQEKLSNGMKIENGILRIQPEDFVILDRIWLRHTPKRVTALTSKSTKEKN